MIDLRILTPHGLFLQQEVTSIHCKSVEGELTLLSNHSPIVLYLVPCRLILGLKDGKKEIFAISGGFLHFDSNNARILTDAIEGSRDIDLQRAQEAYKRARARLEKRDAQVDLHRAELSLQRAINRIQVTETLIN